MRYFLLLSLIIATSLLNVVADTYQQIYNTPGTYSITIPANYAVRASMWGGGGSGAYTSNEQFGPEIYAGGSGAYVSCELNAQPGSTIYLLVGQGGVATSDFPPETTNAIGGGGYGKSTGGNWGASSGGGRSSIQFSSGVDAIVAGGGGGGGSCLKTPDVGCVYGTLGGGGGGGPVGLNGGGTEGRGGYGGTLTAGGAGGYSDADKGAVCGAGSLGNGGNEACGWGSGGGGGYYGGGASGWEGHILAGGGGGSSYTVGCKQSESIVIESGVTPTTSAMVLPGGSSQAGYTSGVGVSGAGTVGSSGSSGGNGAIVLTFSDMDNVNE